MTSRGAAAPGAISAHRGDRGRLHPRVLRQAEIIVAGKGNQPPPVADDLHAAGAFGGVRQRRKACSSRRQSLLVGKGVEAVSWDQL